MSTNKTGNSRGYFDPPALPKTRLGRHRMFSPLAGIHVSPICLGAGSIGDSLRFEHLGMAAMTKESSFQLLDAFYEAGGNFIDTASNYHDGASEIFIGEWMEAKGMRDQMVIATKYTSNFMEAAHIPQKSSFVGNSMKSLHLSIEASIKKLRTTYVDILYVHWWDYNTSVEEVMNGLHHLVAAGKVLYLGVSDAPAWIVTKANTYARMAGKTPFVVYQGAWSILERDFEREIIPMARVEGMALAPWNVLAQGKIRTDAEEERRAKTGENGRTLLSAEWRRTPEQRQVCLALEEVAKEVGAKSITAVAIAYVMQKTPYVFPIVGGRKIEHFQDNIEALSVVLSSKQIEYLEAVLPFESGFPHNLIGDGTQNGLLFNTAGHFDKWPVQQAIRPAV